MCVADGVGSWRNYGVDPKLFAGMSESKFDKFDRSLEVFFSILMVSCSMWSGALDSSGVLQS